MNLLNFFKKSKPIQTNESVGDVTQGNNLANEIIPILKEVMSNGSDYLSNGKPIKEVITLIRTRGDLDDEGNGNLKCQNVEFPNSGDKAIDLTNLYDYGFFFFGYKDQKDNTRIKIYKVVDKLVDSVYYISEEKYNEIKSLDNLRFSKGDTIINNIIDKIKIIIKDENTNLFKKINSVYTHEIGKFQFGVTAREKKYVDKYGIIQPRKENVVFLSYSDRYPISEFRFNEFMSLIGEIDNIKKEIQLKEKFDLLETQSSGTANLSTNYLEKDITTLSEDGLIILKSILLKENEEDVKDYILKTIDNKKLDNTLRYFLYDLTKEFKGIDKVYDGFGSYSMDGGISEKIKNLWGIVSEVSDDGNKSQSDSSWIGYQSKVILDRLDHDKLEREKLFTSINNMGSQGPGGRSWPPGGLEDLK